ncbi:hypothetical protein [Sinorhizobium meliloti]|uniref:hypothetical protein n=1 Tax=Rhizobium meliloti TaxID=382 RepID=UPI000377BDFF|nr:hypothetical protein [Sinorhizobium meliloti]MDE3767571.1 hypothetical protein [Sinorhizobium meliloti]MDE3779799.1 hypothetical protein [Sinorhizobium meliloti]MDE3807424.1 hypothetical protein [Sinorhizobium meliloti]
MLTFLKNVLFSKQLSMHESLSNLVRQLSREEAVLAHNELTYGSFTSYIPFTLHNRDYAGAKPSSVYKEIEVATSLYAYIREKDGSPITRAEKIAYRMGLTTAMSKVLRDRTTDMGKRRQKAAELVAPYHLDRTDLELTDRGNMENIIAEMQTVVH